MHIRDMVPWNRGKQDFPNAEGERDPFHAMQRRMNEAFDDLFKRFNFPAFDWTGGWRGEFNPRVNVTEKDDRVTVEAELPGMDEQDIDVSLSDTVLTLRGERKHEHEEGGSGRLYRREFSYGAFQRAIPLPRKVKAEQVQATFRKGVLRIELPLEPPSEESAHRIPIRTD